LIAPKLLQFKNCSKLHHNLRLSNNNNSYHFAHFLNSKMLTKHAPFLPTMDMITEQRVTTQLQVRFAAITTVIMTESQNLTLAARPN